jgi:hypothetical protein
MFADNYSDDDNNGKFEEEYLDDEFEQSQAA